MSETDNYKTWLITGVSSGIGRSLAEAALAHGHRVVGTVRSREHVAQFEQLSPDRAIAVELDVAQPASVDPGVQAAVQALEGRIDVLVNNAGWGLVGAIEETSMDEARDAFETNFFGQFNVTRSVLPIMRAQGSGHILVSSAIGGFTGIAGLGIYSAAKAAVDVMNEALAQEVAPFGIKVTVLTLGIFRTRFASSSLRQTAQVISEYTQTPAGQFRSFIGGLSGKQPNDPVRAAQAILQIVEADKPPMHLALGSDALRVMNTKIASLQQDMAAWELRSTSVAFPEAAGMQAAGHRS
jgi:NAD(P)-dependent dehydrogenase (short-subunit alcohol dehydrogenase family)